MVRTARFFHYLYITGAAYVVSNSTLHAHAHAHVKLQSRRIMHKQASSCLDMDSQPSSSGSRNSTNSACESDRGSSPPMYSFFLRVAYVCTRLLCATAYSAWLSKQIKNGSSWPRTSKAADGGKHAYPESELQIAENPLGGGRD